MIIDELAKLISCYIEDDEITVLDTCLGLKYTYVLVRGNYGTALGIAFTSSAGISHEGFLEKPLAINNLPKLVSSPGIYYKVLGAALLNALSQYLMFNKKFFRENIVEHIDILDVINLEHVSKALLVGYIHPIAEKLRKWGVEVVSVERDLCKTRMLDHVYIDTVLPRLVKNIDLAIITGSTIVNDSIDYVLETIREIPLKVITGPTAQFPKIGTLSTKYHIDYIGSIHIVDAKGAIRTIKMGGGTKWLLKHGFKYIIK